MGNTDWNKEGKVGEFTWIDVSDELVEEYPEYTDEKGKWAEPKSLLGNLYRQVVKATPLTYTTVLVIVGILHLTLTLEIIYSFMMYGGKHLPESLTGLVVNADSTLYGSSWALVIPATILIVFSTYWVVGWKSENRVTNLTPLLTIVLYPLVITMRMTRNKKGGVYQNIKEEIEHKVKVTNVFKDMLHDKELKENEGYRSLMEKKKELDKYSNNGSVRDNVRYDEIDILLSNGITYEDFSKMYDDLVIGVLNRGEYRQIHLKDMKSVDYLYNDYEPKKYLTLLDYMYESIIDDLNKLVELPNGYVTRKYNILTSKEDGVYFTTDFKEVNIEYSLVDCEPITKDTLKSITMLLESNQKNIIAYNKSMEYQRKIEEDELNRIKFAKEISGRKEDYLNKREDVKNKLMLNSIGDSWLKKEKEVVKDKVKLNKDFVELNR